MRIPLHLNPDDHSHEADLRRIEHHVAMAQLNPKGFRQPGKRSKQTRIERMAERHFSDEND